MMWLLIAREPAPDAAYWRGRRLLALVDAIAWPVALVAALTCAPVDTGLALPVTGAIAAANALARARTALVANQRYRFTTWRCARLFFLLMVVGLTLKIGLALR